MSSRSTEQLHEWEDADVVVLGAGGAGLPAALQALEAGARRVLVLEKRNNPGGNAVFASGIFACESSIQRRHMVEAGADEIFKTAVEWHHHDRVDSRILRAYINRSGETVDWLVGKGIEFAVGPEMMMYAGQNPTWHIALNPASGDMSRFAQVFRMLEREIKARGGTIVTQAQPLAIERDATGAVCAVQVEGAEGPVRVRTRSVVIATGGFIGNKALLKQYFPFFDDNFGGFYVPMQGDGIGLASAAGAALEPYSTLVREAPGSSDEMSERSLGMACREPYVLWVNKLGRRFVDETAAAHLQICSNALLRQPGKQAFALIDSAVIDEVESRGWLLPKYPPGDFHKKFREQMDSASRKRNWACKADTIEELAEWIGADPAALRDQVEDFNRDCERGYDREFAKDRHHLRPLRQGPFYAIRFGVLIIETCGPVRVDEKMRVLDPEWRPVPGLYAAGAVTSGWLGQDYCGEHLFGSALGYAMTSGRIAGEQAAAHAQGDLRETAASPATAQREVA